MKDAQCAETNEKNNFPISIYRIIVKIHQKWTIFRTKMTKIIYFFSKSIQIYMKDPESVESKEKSNFRFFRFLFLELWSFIGHFCDVIIPIFDEFSR